jgi:hypothetical protein
MAATREMRPTKIDQTLKLPRPPTPKRRVTLGLEILCRDNLEMLSIGIVMYHLVLDASCRKRVFWLGLEKIVTASHQ